MLIVRVNNKIKIMTKNELTDEEMLRSFEEFMLSGNNNQCKKTPELSTTRNTSKSTSPKSSSQRSSYTNKISKMEKQSWALFHTFCTIVENKWIHVDDQLFNIITSIDNIRSRIPKEMKLLSRFRDSSMKRLLGFQPIGIDFLTEDDIHLALSHDLLQSEKMMNSLRRLMLDLAEALHMLGRQLDDAYQNHMTLSNFIENFSFQDEAPGDPNEGCTPFSPEVLRLIDYMNEIFVMLSRETYRKQCLSMAVLESFNDGILLKEELNSNNTNVNMQISIGIALREWKRNSTASCMDVYSFNYILKKGKKPTNVT